MNGVVVTITKARTIDQIIGEGNQVPFSGGSSAFQHSLATVNGKPVFTKALTQASLTTALAKVERIPRYLISRLVSIYLHQAFSQAGALEKEARTMEAWHEAGIITPEVMYASPAGLVYEFIDRAVPYQELLQGEAKPHEFEKLLEVYHKIRQVAHSIANPELLHPDPNFSNFLYDPNRDLAIPIDPASILVSAPFAELDSRLNLVFCYDIFRLRTARVTTAHYVEMFADTLTRADARRMLKLNRVVPTAAIAYFAFREIFAHKLKARERLPVSVILPNALKENVGLVNSILSRIA